MSDRDDALDGQLYRALAGALAGLALVAIWAPAMPVGTDLPTHLYFARVVAEPELFARWVDVGYPATAQLFVWALSPFTALGPELAGKIGLSALAALVASGCWAVGRAHDDPRPLGLLLGLALTQSWFSWMGFLNFLVGAGLGLWVVAAVVRAYRTGSTRAWLGAAALGLLMAHAHVIAAGLFGATAALFALLGTRPRPTSAARRVRDTLIACVALAPAAAFSLSVALRARAGYAEDVAVGLSTQRLPVLEVLTNLDATSTGGFVGPLLLVALVVSLVLRARLDRGARAVLVGVAVVWLAAYALLPFHGLGWAFAQPRVLAPLVFTLAGLAHAGPRFRVGLIAIASVCALHLGAATVEGVRVGAAVQAQVERSEGVAPGLTMEFVTTPGETRIPYVDPLIHTGKYALWRGGASTLLPAYNAMIHSVELRDAPPPHPPLFIYRALEGDAATRVAAQRTLNDRVAVQGTRFDAVAIVGEPGPWLPGLLSRGYTMEANGVLRPHPGAIQIVVPVPAEAQPYPVAIRAGYPDTLGWLFETTRRAENGEVRIAIERLPAGMLTVEARVVTDGRENGAFAANETNVQPSGRTTVTLTPTAP